MAGKEFPLSIIIRAVDRATADLRKIDRRVAKFGRNVADTGRTLTTHLTLPIIGLGAASVHTLSTFEAGMSNISTLIDSSAESVDAMGEEVLRMGRRVPVAVNDLTASLYNVRSAGVSAADQFAVLEQSARLGVAGLGTTEQAVDLVTSSLNAFQLKGEDAAGVYDLIFKTVKSGKTNIAQLSTGFGAVAGTVAESGTQLDEYLASVAALTTTGLPAAQAHSQLRAVLSGLTRDTKESRAVFQALGAKDFKDLIAQSGGLVPALSRISDTLGGNTTEIFKLVGSSEALNAIIGLTGKQGAAYAATLDDMRNGANAVDVAFDKQNKTLRSSSQRTKNALVSAGVAIGKVLTPALEKLAEVLERVAAWFDGLSSTQKKWLVGVAAAVAAVGPFLMILGKMITAFAVLRSGIMIAVAAVRIMGAALIANPLGALITAIAVAGALIYKEWDLIKEFFVMLWDGIVDVFKSAWAWISDIIDNVVGGAKKIIAAAESVSDYFGGGSGESTSRAQLEQQLRAGGMQERDVQRILAAKFPGQRPSMLGPEPTPPQREKIKESRIKIDIANAPRGTRAEVDRGSDDDIHLSMGVQLVTP